MLIDHLTCHPGLSRTLVILPKSSSLLRAGLQYSSIRGSLALQCPHSGVKMWVPAPCQRQTSQSGLAIQETPRCIADVLVWCSTSNSKAPQVAYNYMVNQDPNIFSAYVIVWLLSPRSAMPKKASQFLFNGEIILNAMK